MTYSFSPAKKPKTLSDEKGVVHSEYTANYIVPKQGANNADAIGDVVSSFSNADDLDVDCRSNLINLDKKAIIFLLMILF